MLGSFDFLFVFFRQIAQFLNVWMTEQCIAVERYLGIENAHAAICHDDQRVDFQKAHVLVGEGLVEDREQLEAVFTGFTFKLQRIGELVGTFIGHALGRIDCDRDDLLRGLFSDSFDVHAAFSRNDESRTANGAVDQDREIKLALNVCAIFDVKTIDLLASFAGLLGDERVAEHVLGVSLGFIDREGKTNAALGVGGKFLELALAAAASMDLALDHVERARELLGSGFCLFCGEDRDTFRDRRAIALQESLGLIFMNVHGVFPVWSILQTGETPAVAQMRQKQRG
ncbi:hypothetical protein D9M72_439740 [compost metagenome]